jgi:cold shock CspA family protein
MSQQVQSRMTGTVKWFNPRKGFGFAASDNGGQDVFIHQSALESANRLNEGDRIEFAVERGQKGLSAVSVVALGGAAPRIEVLRTDSQAGDGFADLGLIAPLLRAVAEEGYTEPTPIQVQAIPHVLNGRNLLGCAQTGTGKTAAFALPILQRLTEAAPRRENRARRIIRVLVLTPTRELATQIGVSFATYGRHAGFKHTTVYGGVGQNPQVSALRAGVDILVATPGRLLDLIGQGYISLTTSRFSCSTKRRRCSTWLYP